MDDIAIPSSTPYLPDVGVLGLVPDAWEDVWMPRHQILSHLSRFYNVVWMNPAKEWRTIVASRAESKPEKNDLTRLNGFLVYEPEKWLPLLYRPRFLANFFFRLRLKRAQNLLSHPGSRKIVLYLWRPEFERALALSEYDLSVYHIDDEYSFSTVENSISETEARILANVDQVFIHSPALFDKKGTINSNTDLVPNGVNYKSFSKPATEPHDMAPIPHPRIGYTGRLKNQLDWQLLSNLALKHPEWSFVFIGPQAPHPEITNFINELSCQPNVFFLGAKSVQDLALYPQHFDICIMPYRANDYTKFIYPLKLHEYLASGRPVVGTYIRTLHDFADVVTLVREPDDWSLAIKKALGPLNNTTERRAARQEVARQHDWQLLVIRVAKKIAQGLGQEYAGRLEKVLSKYVKSADAG